MTEQQKQTLAQLGIDWSKIDWARVGEIVKILLLIFLQPSPMQTAKASGCPDEVAHCCCCCMDAGRLALESAAISFQCCDDCCTKGGKP